MSELRLTDSQRLAYREAVLASGPSLFLPLDAVDGLTNLAETDYVAAAAGGLTPGGLSSGPLTAPNDTGATLFDGSDDRITTDYGTRRNLALNPSFETNTTNWQSYQSGVITLTRETGGFGIGDYNLKVVTDGGAAYQAARNTITGLTPSVTYTASAYVKTTAGNLMSIGLLERTAASASVGQTFTTFVGTGNWERVSVSRTFGATGVEAWVVIGLNTTAAYTFYVDGVLLEQAASAGTYFDGSGYIDNNGNWIDDSGGHVGWLGTAHASASDKGCFANGTVRSFTWWLNPHTQATQQCCFANEVSGYGLIIVGQLSSAHMWLNMGAAVLSWSSAMSGQVGLWGLCQMVIDQPNATAEFYLNGVSKGQYATPGTGEWASNATVMFGKCYSGQPLNGDAMGLAIHERGLSAYEIADLYAAASRPTRSYDFLDADANTKVQVEGLTLPVPARDDTWVETPDADGRRRLRSRVGTAEGSFSVWIREDTAADFWDAVDSLQELVESANRNKGQLTYTPPDGTPVTFDLEAITVSELPQRGVLLRQYACEATVSFECQPYGRLPEQYVTAGATLTGPIDSFTLTNIPGQLPAWGHLRLDDPESEARSHIEVGVQADYDPDNAEALSLEAVTDISAAAGASSTQTGSVSTNTLLCPLSASPVVIGVAEDLPHAGKWKVRARVYSDGTGTRVRAAFRSGTAPFATSPKGWVSVPGDSSLNDDWYDLDLGTIDIPRLPSGHTCEVRVEGAAQTGVVAVDLDTLSMIPADSYTRLRGSTTEDLPTSAIVGFEDASDLSTAALNGQAPTYLEGGYSGNWTVAGGGGTYYAQAGQYIYIEGHSDSSSEVALMGSTTASTYQTVRARVSADSYGWETGVLLRYVDSSNYAEAVIAADTALKATYVRLYKKVSGTRTLLNEVFLGYGAAPAYIYAGADEAGNVSVLTSDDGTSFTWRILRLADSVFATSGALDNGGFGLTHYVSGSTYSTATFREIIVTEGSDDVTVTNPAIVADGGLDLLHNTALSDNGTGQGLTPTREGQYLTLPPATRGGRQSRVVVKGRRLDVDGGLPDTGEDDDLTAGLTVTPRVYLLGE